MITKSTTPVRRYPTPRPSTLPSMAILLLLLSIWRIAACFTEYSDGPFVTLMVALVDVTPFLALVFGVMALCCWRQNRRMMRYCLVSVISLLAVTTCDLTLFSATFRSRLHTGSWIGSANIVAGNGDPTLEVTFRNDDEAVITLGGAGHTTLYRGAWQTSFNPYLARPKEVQFPGFGHADYLKGDRLHIKGVFVSSGTSNQIVAILGHVSTDLE
jgi:hypothetical protein